MTGQYGPPPAAPPPPGAPGGPGAAGPRTPPPSTVMAIRLIWVSIVISLIAIVIQFTQLDAIIDQAIQDVGGVGVVDEDLVRSSAIVGIVITIVLSVGFAALFAFLLRKGKNWARIVYTVLLGLSIISTLTQLTNQPGIGVVLTLGGMLLSVAIAVLLFRKDSNQFFAASSA